MKQMVVSVRIPGGDSKSSAFADLTHRWLDELADDFERQMGQPFEGGNGVLFGCDVLVALHGAKASWELFDVEAFERYILEEAPGFVIALPTMLADLVAFTNFLARQGRIAPERSEATQARFFAMLGREVHRGKTTPRGDADDAPPPLNRAERRAAAARRRRAH
ncbi:MAG: hypothetical protein M3Y87_04445 [Myxococcota bacterium]|nr:hypothetical protein [Myxococcota bacterium]